MNEEQIAAMTRSKREQALAETEARRASQPLRYLRQQAHLTAPASNPDLAGKAIASGFGVAGRLLQRYGISPADLGGRLGVATAEVEELLAGDTSAPLVMLDLEDGVAPHLAGQARENVVSLFREGKWGGSLRFYRSSGLTDGRCVDDVAVVLLRAGQGLPPEQYPIDGLVFPKVQHVHEIEWLYGTLDAVEDALGLPRNRIRVSYLIEAGWALLNLRDLVAAGIDRLSALILGFVDLSADVQLPAVRNRHPVVEWARHVIVTAAGAADVPAIDSMTLSFPVASPSLGPAENKDLILSRMEENFADARYSMDLGMAGRWVGHPLQLLATMLAYRTALDADALEAEVAKVEEFSRAIAADKGAAAGKSGELLDIATDRHARRVLRQATAWGRFPKARALGLGIITAVEAKELP